MTEGCDVWTVCSAGEVVYIRSGLFVGLGKQSMLGRPKRREGK